MLRDLLEHWKTVAISKNVYFDVLDDIDDILVILFCGHT